MKTATTLRCVNIESPLRGRVPLWVPRFIAPLVERFGRWRHKRYAFECVRDSLKRGECPYASHVFFDRRGILDDAEPIQRAQGMLAGAQWARRADVFAVYCDFGISSGMQDGIKLANKEGIRVDFRYLYPPHESIAEDDDTTPSMVVPANTNGTGTGERRQA